MTETLQHKADLALRCKVDLVKGIHRDSAVSRSGRHQMGKGRSGAMLLARVGLRWTEFLRRRSPGGMRPARWTSGRSRHKVFEQLKEFDLEAPVV